VLNIIKYFTVIIMYLNNNEKQRLQFKLDYKCGTMQKSATRTSLI